MPEGPLGFPRLTTIGPLTKPSTIQPAEEFKNDVFSLSFIQSNQSITGEDTRTALKDILDFELDVFPEVQPEDTEFRFHKRKIADILEINEFSSSLLEAMSRAEQKGIPLKAKEIGRMEIENEKLEEEARSHMKGGSSIFTDETLSGIDKEWERLAQGKTPPRTSESEVVNRILDKVIADFDRVIEIADNIEDDNIYFPPTIEDIELGGVLGWGTIDGAHRVVALSQLLGTEEEIFVWEWENQKALMDQSPRF